MVGEGEGLGRVGGEPLCSEQCQPLCTARCMPSRSIVAIAGKLITRLLPFIMEMHCSANVMLCPCHAVWWAEGSGDAETLRNCMV